MKEKIFVTYKKKSYKYVSVFGTEHYIENPHFSYKYFYVSDAFHTQVKKKSRANILF